VASWGVWKGSSHSQGASILPFEETFSLETSGSEAFWAREESLGPLEFLMQSMEGGF